MLPSPLVIVVALIVCGFAASFLARWLLEGKLDLSRTKACVLILLALTIFCYVNSFSNGFVWDDTPLIVENRSVRNWHNWPQAFTSDLYNDPLTQTFYYRPLQALSYRLDYTVWGLHPDGYHAINILLHAGNGILVFLLVRRFTQNATLALACGALWVVHPIHTQAVTYISGRADPMCAFFLLLTFWFYIEARAQSSSKWMLWLGLSAVTFAAALCSKEFAMFFPGLLLAFEVVNPLAESRDNLARKCLRIAPFVVLVLGYWALRKNLFGAASPPVTDAATGFSPFTLCLRALAGYISLLMAPLNLHVEQTVAFKDWRGAQLTITGCFALASFVGLTAIYWRRSRVTCFALVWFLLFFLPVSNLWPLNATLAEHWMYFPSIGFLWATCAIGYDLITHWKRIADRSALIGATAAVFLVIGYGARTALRNPDWRNEIVFNSRTILAGGDTARVRNNLGRALFARDTNEVEAAELEYKEALKLDPQYDPALNNLGLLYLQKREFGKAIALFEQTLQLRPWRVEACVNLAAAYGDAGQIDQACSVFQEAADKFPQSTLVAFRYGLFALWEGKLDIAEKELTRAQQLSPDSAEFANALGGLAIEQEKTDAAVAHFTRAKGLDRFNTNPYRNLALLYQKQGRFADAEREFRGALQIEPNSPEFHYRLGVLYWRTGQTADAKRALAKALELYPQFNTAMETLAKVERGIAYSMPAADSVLGLKAPEPAAAN